MTVDQLEPAEGLTRSHDTGPLSDTTMITVRVTLETMLHPLSMYEIPVL